MDKFLIPNFHVILIHFPLALLGAGVAIELFSFMWRRSSFRQAGQWMIVIGTLAAIPAVTSGLYAFRNVMGHGSEFDSMVEYQTASGFTDADWHFMRNHIILNSIATGVALIAVVAWLAGSDRWRKLMRIPDSVPAGRCHGVHDPGGMARRRDGVSPRVCGAGPTVRPPGPGDPSPRTSQEKIEYFAPEGEVHLLMAGIVFAVAAVALGLSIRRALTTETVDRAAGSTELYFRRGPAGGNRQADLPPAGIE